MAHVYELPPLPYAYDALEPLIDERTMRLHHDKHHRGYVNGLNRALAMLAQARESGELGLIKHWSREAAFHGSGHFLHCIFWPNMAPPGSGGGDLPPGVLAAQIEQDFGSFAAFKTHFSKAAATVEGNGWGVLVWEPVGEMLQILQVESHHTLSQWGARPLLALDVWEHAYYLKYQNDRGAYIDAWWQVVNWADVAERLKAARALP